MADDLTVGSGLPREHWEGILPRHLMQRSREKGEPMWTPTQFEAAFEVLGKAPADAGYELLIVSRRSDGIPGTIRKDPTGWHYAFQPDYSQGGMR